MTPSHPIETQEYRDRCIAARAAQVGPPTPLSAAEEDELAWHEDRLESEAWTAPRGIPSYTCPIPYPMPPHGERLRWFFSALIGRPWYKHEARRIRRVEENNALHFERWKAVVDRAAIARQAEYDVLVAMMGGENSGSQR